MVLEFHKRNRFYFSFMNFFSPKSEMLQTINQLQTIVNGKQSALKHEIQINSEWKKIDVFPFKLTISKSCFLKNSSALLDSFNLLKLTHENHFPTTEHDCLKIFLEPFTPNMLDSVVKHFECNCMFGLLDNVMCVGCILLNDCWSILDGKCKGCEKGKNDTISIKNLIVPKMSSHGELCWSCMEKNNSMNECLMCSNCERIKTIDDKKTCSCGTCERIKAGDDKTISKCRCYIFYPRRYCQFQTVFVSVFNNRIVEHGTCPTKLDFKLGSDKSCRLMRHLIEEQNEMNVKELIEMRKLHEIIEKLNVMF